MNVLVMVTGIRLAVTGRPNHMKTEDRRLKTGDRRPDTGRRTPDSGRLKTLTKDVLNSRSPAFTIETYGAWLWKEGMEFTDSIKSIK